MADCIVRNEGWGTLDDLHNHPGSLFANGYLAMTPMKACDCAGRAMLAAKQYIRHSQWRRTMGNTLTISKPQQPLHMAGLA